MTYDQKVRAIAADTLDIAIRCHFTQTGIEAVVARLKAAFPDQTPDLTAAVVVTPDVAVPAKPVAKKGPKA